MTEIDQMPWTDLPTLLVNRKYKKENYLFNLRDIHSTKLKKILKRDSFVEDENLKPFESMKVKLRGLNTNGKKAYLIKRFKGNKISSEMYKMPTSPNKYAPKICEFTVTWMYLNSFLLYT